MIYGSRADSERYVAHLREIGVQVGEDVTIYSPTKTTIDECYPWLLTIGNCVKIAQGVIILNHNYSWSVLKRNGGAILGSSGKVSIGNNVFIGMNAIIMPNTRIGNNVVIGAGSVVTKDCPDNGVYVGNPARRITDLDTFIQKRREAQLAEAKTLAVEYHSRFGVTPPEEIFHEYFMLFETADSAQKKAWCLNKMQLCGNYDETLAYMQNNEPMFPDYEAFLQYCLPEVTK